MTHYSSFTIVKLNQTKYDNSKSQTWSALLARDVILIWIRPGLFLSRSKDGVESDAAKVNEAGDEKDRLPFGCSLKEYKTDEK